LDTCVRVITYKDVVEGGDYAPTYADSDVVAPTSDLVCVANAINLAGYFFESQPCVKDTNTGCLAEVVADTLLQLTFIDGVFSAEGTHRNGRRDNDYKSPQCPKLNCECYESLEKFRSAEAGLYVYNSASYVVSNKIQTWACPPSTSGGTDGIDWEAAMIEVNTIIVAGSDDFKVFKGYDVHARNEPLALINKVAPRNHGLVASIATVTNVDAGSTETKADDDLAFFLALAAGPAGFGRTLLAYDKVYKTGRSDGVGNSYNLAGPLGGQGVVPVNYTLDTNGDCAK
jgi:hypothetical protein